MWVLCSASYFEPVTRKLDSHKKTGVRAQGSSEVLRTETLEEERVGGGDPEQ